MATPNVQYEIPTWNQIYDMLIEQAQKIQRTYHPDVVVGVAKGGVVPARVLADLLETPELAFIQICLYVDIAQAKEEPTLKQPLTVPVKDKKVLVVDDIADSGNSLRLAESHLQAQGAVQIKTATLYLKPSSATIPDFYEKRTGSWVVFPWETRETLRKLIQKQPGKRAANAEIAKLVKAGLPKQVAEKLLEDMQ